MAEKKRPTVSELRQLEKKKTKSKTRSKLHIWLSVFLFLGLLSPLAVVYVGVYGAKNEMSSLGFSKLPSIKELENPKSNLATLIISSNGEEIGKYYKQNRTTVQFEEISPYMIDALVATEDERYFDHSGIDVVALLRAIKGMGKSGGASTLSQQLSKMLFSEKPKSKFDRIRQKFQEWVIAVELEKRFTKEEILAMYLNRFDFLNQAVGVKSASKIYFNKLPIELKKEEAAFLAGMFKNPVAYNPLRFEKNALGRREVVLKQWLKNSEKENEALSTYISVQEYDSLRKLPLGIDYQRQSHDEGIAPYFREILRKRVEQILAEKDKDGDYEIVNADGRKYDVYKDGLRIYTTIDSRMQRYAEKAVETHLGKTLQSKFFEVNKGLKNWPFDDSVTQSMVNSKLQIEINELDLYKKLTGKLCPDCGRGANSIVKRDTMFHCTFPERPYDWKVLSQKQISDTLRVPVKTKVFTWENKVHEKDTMISPLDLIKYKKAILQAGFMAVDPHTGFIKAWVGGPDFKHFKYDHVKLSKRQVGSTFKPFVYATVFRDKEGVVTPCTEITDKIYCLDVYNADNQQISWCPESGGHPYDNKPMSLKYGLANSYNHITAWVMSQTTPQAVRQLANDLGIDTRRMQAVPSMALGVFDVNVFDMVGAYAAFVNKGMFIEPTYISKIEDEYGNIIYEAEIEMNVALDENTANTMLELMKGVVKGVSSPYRDRKAGTAMRLRGGATKDRPYAGIYNPVAGKTGTTQNNADGWFMGLTPDLVAGTWVGSDDMAVRFADTKYGQGANMALPIWAYFMKAVYADASLNVTKADFTMPSDFDPCYSSNIIIETSTEDNEQSLDDLP